METKSKLKRARRSVGRGRSVKSMGGGGPDPVEGDVWTISADGKRRRGWEKSTTQVGNTTAWMLGGGSKGRWRREWEETTPLGKVVAARLGLSSRTRALVGSPGDGRG
jgi:hypothetical protein